MKPRILLVEDDEFISSLVRTVLINAGLEVVIIDRFEALRSLEPFGFDDARSRSPGIAALLVSGLGDSILPDRATYFSPTLLARIRNLVTSSANDENATDREVTNSHESVVSKVLAVEEGITDGTTIKLVASALPRVTAMATASDREVRDFADFLRVHLKL